MKKQLLYTILPGVFGLLIIIVAGSFIIPDKAKECKAASSGELTFTVRTVPAGGNFAPKHVLAIWIEDANGFVKTRKAMANQRKQYLYTWHAASNYNVVDAITGSTLTSHQTHTITWDCTDLDGTIVPDGDYTVWVEFTDQHAQGPLYTITFTKGPNAQSMSPPDETYFKDLQLDFTPYVADFSYDTSVICQWETVTYTDLSVNATSWEWNFGEGAAPASASTQGPHTVYYTTPGIKTVSLTINGDLTEVKQDLISVGVKPDAEFEFGGNALTVDFTNLSANATTYLWDFGDGETSTDNNPTHTYSNAGSFNVTLTANGTDCTDIISHQVDVPLVGLEAKYANELFSICPNPNSGIFYIDMEKISNRSAIVKIFDHTGNLVREINCKNNEEGPLVVNLENEAKGMYFVHVAAGNLLSTEKVLIK